jgi:hypothetical protein
MPPQEGINQDLFLAALSRHESGVLHPGRDLKKLG